MFSPDGRRVAFVGSKDNRHDVAIDDKSEGPYKAVQPPVFSADGARTVYAAKAADAWQVYVDGKSVGSYGQVEGVQASRVTARLPTRSRALHALLPSSGQPSRASNPADPSQPTTSQSGSPFVQHPPAVAGGRRRDRRVVSDT